MSLECSICECDMRGPHDENCPRHPKWAIGTLESVLQMLEERRSFLSRLIEPDIKLAKKRHKRLKSIRSKIALERLIGTNVGQDRSLYRLRCDIQIRIEKLKKISEVEI